MKHITTYEWVVEEMDPTDPEEIVDTSGYATLAEAREWASLSDMPTVISLRRDVAEVDPGCEPDLVDRQYAYPGATEFEGGAAIPKRFQRDFASLEIAA